MKSFNIDEFNYKIKASILLDIEDDTFEDKGLSWLHSENKKSLIKTVSKNKDTYVISFKNKTVALFCLGDQDGYKDTYANAMGIIYDVVINNNGVVIGKWPIEGYSYGNNTTAVRKGQFIGLPLDEINQPELTKKRVDKWVQILKKEFI